MDNKGFVFNMAVAVMILSSSMLGQQISADESRSGAQRGVANEMRAAAEVTSPSPGSAHSTPKRRPIQRAEFIVKIEAGNLQTGRSYGHGICLDSPCVHVLTNYHVAGLLPDAKVEGMSVKSARYGTGSDDAGAVPIRVLGGVRNWNPQRDIALLTLEKPLSAKYGAARFSHAPLYEGMNVVRFPVTTDTYRGKLWHIGPVRYQDATSAEHQLDSALVTDFDSPLGVSGGALCDESGNVIGLTELHNRSLALPITVISEFLRTANPALWSQLRLDMPSVGAAAEKDMDTQIPTVIVGISADPKAAIADLIAGAVNMREQMTRVVAQSEIRRSGPWIREQTEHYEVSLFQSGLRFRRMLPNGQLGGELDDTPMPDHGVIPSADWNYLLAGLASSKVMYVGETIHDDRIAHVFRFAGMSCPFREQRPSYFWSGSVECEGEVLADLTFHPVQITANLLFERESILSKMRIEVSFAIANLEPGHSIYLPSTVAIRAKYKHSFGTYTASNSFRKYRLFQATHVIREDAGTIASK